MPAFKHVAKQRKLSDKNVEQQLSDEESSGDEEVVLGSDSDSEDDTSDSDADEDDDDSQDEDGEEEEAEAGKLVPPMPPFPTALAALENPICFPAAEGGEEGAEEGSPICVVCPDKKIKHKEMLAVHLGSKHHKRRLARLSTYLTNSSTTLASSHPNAAFSAVQVVELLDKNVFEKLVDQATHGGPSPSKSKDGRPEISVEEKAKKREESSRRAKKREEKRKLVERKRSAKKEKKDRLRAKKAAVAEGDTEGGKKEVLSKKEEKKRLYKKLLPKPTKEEIALRQAAKIAKRQAAATGAAPKVETKDKGKKRKAPESEKVETKEAEVDERTAKRKERKLLKREKRKEGAAVVA